MASITPPTSSQLMAVFEIDIDDAGLLVALDLSQGRKEIELRRSRTSPPGFQWLELHMDEALGSRRKSITASGILRALRGEAQAGRLRGFRVISGEHWLDGPDIVPRAGYEWPSGYSPTRMPS